MSHSDGRRLCSRFFFKALTPASQALKHWAWYGALKCQDSEPFQTYHLRWSDWLKSMKRWRCRLRRMNMESPVPPHETWFQTTLVYNLVSQPSIRYQPRMKPVPGNPDRVQCRFTVPQKAGKNHRWIYAQEGRPLWRWNLLRGEFTLIRKYGTVPRGGFVSVSARKETRAGTNTIRVICSHVSLSTINPL